MSYKFKAYNQLTGPYPSFKKIESDEWFDITWEEQKIHNGTLYLFYECRHFMPFEKNQWIYTLHLTEVEKEILGEALRLGENCTKASVRKTLIRYPFITELLYGDESRDSYICSYVSYVAGYLHILVHANEISDKDRDDALSKLFSMLEGIKRECGNFYYSTEHLELTEWAKQKIEWELEKQKNPQITASKYKNKSKLEKYLLIAGIICLKFAVKSVGGDLNIDIPFDAPDVDIPDVDIPDVDVPDVDVPDVDVPDVDVPNVDVPDVDVPDVDVPDVDGYNDETTNTPAQYEYLENQYNPTFDANKKIGDDLYLDKGYSVTLEPAGGGLGEEKPTVYVEAGTNTRYILDGNTPRKIDGVSQVTYKGRKWIIVK